MSENKRPEGALPSRPSGDLPSPEKKPDPPTSPGRRVAAAVAAALVIAFTVFYVYSIATGGIFQW